MTGDEMERAIDFLLQGRANHEARLGALTEQVGELAGTVNQLSGTVNQLTEQVVETNRLMQLHLETQTSFIQIVTRHIEAQGEINTSLRANINRTDARLDRLEAVVERYIEGRNGQS
ncbi:MAG TPA: hypothetical protein VGO96_01695 [Pyrinomonadaceae bacterium]|jgi:chromosome segregation ATPase|nr:hypothetical protein [Pyrinomonadaceae bacterium]